MQQKPISIYRTLLAHHGISAFKAQNICEKLGISLTTQEQQLSQNKKDALNAAIIHLTKTKPGINAELKLYTYNNIQEEIKLNSHRWKTTQIITTR